jgi:hypothetical protein
VETWSAILSKSTACVMMMMIMIPIRPCRRRCRRRRRKYTLIVGLARRAARPSSGRQAGRRAARPYIRLSLLLLLLHGSLCLVAAAASAPPTPRTWIALLGADGGVYRHDTSSSSKQPSDERPSIQSFFVLQAAAAEATWEYRKNKGM